MSGSRTLHNHVRREWSHPFLLGPNCICKGFSIAPHSPLRFMDTNFRERKRDYPSRKTVLPNDGVAIASEDMLVHNRGTNLFGWVSCKNAGDTSCLHRAPPAPSSLLLSKCISLRFHWVCSKTLGWFHGLLFVDSWWLVPNSLFWIFRSLVRKLDPSLCSLVPPHFLLIVVQGFSLVLLLGTGFLASRTTWKEAPEDDHSYDASPRLRSRSEDWNGFLCIYTAFLGRFLDLLFCKWSFVGIMTTIVCLR